MLSNVNKSSVYEYDHDENVTATSESDEKPCSSDNQIFSVRNIEQLRKGRFTKALLKVNVEIRWLLQMICLIWEQEPRKETICTSETFILAMVTNICRALRLQLVHKDIPVAHVSWTERQIQRHAVMNSLVVEVKDKTKPLSEFC